MYPFTYLETYIEELYFYYEISKRPSIDDVARKLDLRVIFNCPTSYIRNEIILIETGTPEEEWEHFAHELGHYFRDNGSRQLLPLQYEHYIEHRAENFMYHFCVPSFLLVQEDLPFCRTEAIHTIMKRYGVTKAFAKKRLDMYERKLLELHYYE